MNEFHSIMDRYLSRSDTERLAQFNSEVARGLMHRPEYVAEMAELQRKFDLGAQRYKEYCEGFRNAYAS